MPSPVLRDLTLCTYSTGTVMVREVLEDWFEFLGGQPAGVVFAVTPAANPPSVYAELADEGLIDRTIYLDAGGRSVYEMEIAALRTAVEAAATEWILLAKLDTLPYRKGHEDWLDETIAALRASDCIGLVGSGSMYYDVRPGPGPFVRVRRFTNNFAIIRRADWLAIQDRFVGRDLDGPLLRKPEFAGDMVRIAGEIAVDEYLNENGLFLLARRESRQWSVFHVNVWGDRLRQVRQKYRARAGIAPHLFRGRPHSPYSFTRPWIRYYGHPAPGFFRLAKKYIFYWIHRFASGILCPG